MADNGNRPVMVNDLKEELKKFATKDDLKKFATKDDLKKFATKEEMHKMGDMLAREIQRLHDSDKKRETQFHTLLHAIEGLAGKIDTYRTEKFAADHTMDRHEKILFDHGERIKSLEEKTV